MNVALNLNGAAGALKTNHDNMIVNMFDTDRPTMSNIEVPLITLNHNDTWTCHVKEGAFLFIMGIDI